jgi:hypothetical protein
MALLTSFQAFVVNAQGMFDIDSPAVLVMLLSLVLGLLMVVVFRYTSDQTGIRIAKDHLQAHLLAVQLFQDQLPVVLSSYGRILISTGSYLQLAFKPLLFVILPLTFLMVQLDRYLGSTPLPAGQAFLITAHTSDAATRDVIAASRDDRDRPSGACAGRQRSGVASCS